MSTSLAQLKTWYENGKKAGASHLIVVVDTFEHDDYPVYVNPKEDVNVRVKVYNGKEMQRVMEVYALHKPFDKQDPVGGRLCWDLSYPPPKTSAEIPPTRILSLYDQLLGTFMVHAEVAFQTRTKLGVRTPKKELLRQDTALLRTVEALVAHGVTPDMAKKMDCPLLAEALRPRSKWRRKG